MGENSRRLPICSEYAPPQWVNHDYVSILHRSALKFLVFPEQLRCRGRKARPGLYTLANAFLGFFSNTFLEPEGEPARFHVQGKL